jgi:hypothetical protein
MKLEKLKLKNKTLSRESMNITFGGYCQRGTNCSSTGSSGLDCCDLEGD